MPSLTIAGINIKIFRIVMSKVLAIDSKTQLVLVLGLLLEVLLVGGFILGGLFR